MIGCSIAYELAKTGRTVTVVDKSGGPGQGSTSASSAIIRFNYSTYDAVATAWESKHCWAEWREHLGATADEPLARLHRTGFVMLDAPVAPPERTMALFDRAGVPYERWDAATLRARIPALDPGRHWPPKRPTDEAFWVEADGELGALYCPDGGYVDDPALAAVNLADAARRHGVGFRFHRRVTAVPRGSEGRVAGVRLDDGSALEAGVVVNAAGPWSSALNRLADVGAEFAVGTRPLRQEVHHVAAPPGYHGDADDGPVVGDLDLGTYLRGAAGGGLLVGGTEPECDPLQWVDDPDEANPHPTVPVYEAQLNRAALRLPGLAVPPTPRGIAGVYDVADDWTPIYDRTALPGFYVAIGTSGNQFKNAPLAGRFLARVIDAVEAGHDHDREPVTCSGRHTGLVINIGAFSRLRHAGADAPRSVMG